MTPLGATPYRNEGAAVIDSTGHEVAMCFTTTIAAEIVAACNSRESLVGACLDLMEIIRRAERDGHKITTRDAQQFLEIERLIN